MPDSFVMAQGLVIRPGDTLVIATAVHMTASEAEELKAQARRGIPTLADVIVISGVTGLAVVRPDTDREGSDA